MKKGVLNAKENYASKSVCYIRTIESMETDMNYGRICNFIDVLPMRETTGLYVTDDMLDSLAQLKLSNLREVCISKSISD